MNNFLSRRKFLKNLALSCGSLIVGYSAVNKLFKNNKKLEIGFANQAPSGLWLWSKEAKHYVKQSDYIYCHLCPQECVLQENDRGFCRVKVVKNKKLYSLVYGNPCAVNVDPIEKKPFFHFKPQTKVLSLATAGCNLRCINCQNWEISQATPEETQNNSLMPAQISEAATQNKIPGIAYTYSEPLMFYEYVEDSAKIAKKNKLYNVLVTAGYINEEPLRNILKNIEGVTLDLKAFDNEFYKKISLARLEPILKTIKIIKEENVWLELSNLVISNLSDNLKSIYNFCKWIVNEIGPDQPLHFLRFYPAYKLTTYPPTPVETLEEARNTALKAGLKFVYIGNVPGHKAQNTYCPKDGELLIEREGYNVLRFNLKNGKCKCGEKIPGVWS